jgi:hypothetical protein
VLSEVSEGSIHVIHLVNGLMFLMTGDSPRLPVSAQAHRRRAVMRNRTTNIAVLIFIYVSGFRIRVSYL